MFDAVETNANREYCEKLVQLANEKHGKTILPRGQIEQLFEEIGSKPKYWVFCERQKRGRGIYEVQAHELVLNGIDPKGLISDSPLVDSVPQETREAAAPFEMTAVSYVPECDPEFVPTMYYKKIHSIILSGIFMPSYVVGLSGMGKTVSIIEAAARLKRELVRVNFTEETSERHLIGGWRIHDGNTVWEDGPVLVAMKRGAVLLLDEVDFATAKVLCLQSILEGSSYINKQTGEIVRPAPGFTIFATANTKGQVSGRDARFVGARNQNEAFLDRFELTMEQDYPKPEVEAKILLNKFIKLFGRAPNEKEAETLTTLTKWSEAIRHAYGTGGVNDIVSTRRLGSLLKSWKIFGNLNVAINDVLARFNPETRKGFVSFYNQLSAEQITTDATTDGDDE